MSVTFDIRKKNKKELSFTFKGHKCFIKEETIRIGCQTFNRKSLYYVLDSLSIRGGSKPLQSIDLIEHSAFITRRGITWGSINLDWEEVDELLEKLKSFDS